MQRNKSRAPRDVYAFSEVMKIRKKELDKRVRGRGADGISKPKRKKPAEWLNKR